jgi:hypothetical protein
LYLSLGVSVYIAKIALVYIHINGAENVDPLQELQQSTVMLMTSEYFSMGAKPK